MAGRSLDDWLQWQESLNASEIDLGLDRITKVANRLDLQPPEGSVFIVAGTNGKGSCVWLLEQLLLAGGVRTGAYTSPHLLRYNERIRIDGVPVDDHVLVKAFERIEAARGEQALTYFEYGTLAALWIFSNTLCDAWLLEVGLGGRLDAVNIVEPNYSLITTIALDHQVWLGNDVEQIAREKAGIMREATPAFFGDYPAPAAIGQRASELGSPLLCLRDAFDYSLEDTTWTWRGQHCEIEALPWPPGRAEEQIRNLSLVLAVLERHDPALLERRHLICELAERFRLPGRFQVVNGDRQWVLDVAHNPQAASGLRHKLEALGPVPFTTAVVGLMADKPAADFALDLSGQVDQWITCTVDATRGRDGVDLARCLEEAGLGPVRSADTPESAFQLACESTPPGSRILVCGSFYVVGPALEWLGLY